MIAEHRGIDVNKKVNGRIWRIKVHVANLHDGPAACALILDCSEINQRLKKILGDEAYKGVFADQAAKEALLALCLPALSKSRGSPGFLTRCGLSAGLQTGVLRLHL